MIEEGLPPGTIVEGYVIERVLGQGGFAITYLAHDAHLVESRVALKEYFPQDLARRTQRLEVAAPAPRAQAYREGLERFLEEARTLIRLPEHPGVVRAHRYVPANGTAYLVMEYVPGESLADALKRRPRSHWDEERVRRLAAQLLDALRVVHGAGVWHRDVNPSNVLLRADERPVLIDFGASRQVQARRTRTGQRVATSGYSPPEQYGSGQGDPGAWSDLYALGATLYEVVTGMQPAESLARLAGRMKDKDPLVPAVAAASGRYSPDLLGWIDWHLQIEEAKRPQSALQGLAFLQGLAVSGAGPVAKTAPVGSAQRFEMGKGEARDVPIARPRAGVARRWVALAVLFTACVGVVAGAILVDHLGVVVAQSERADTEKAGAAPKGRPKTGLLRPVSDPLVQVPVPEMVTVPAGAFTMGSPSYEEFGNSSERPLRDVSIRPFRMGKYEVTREEFRRFTAATGHVTDAEQNVDVPEGDVRTAGGANPGCYTHRQGQVDLDWVEGLNWRDTGFDQADDHPVVCVSFDDVQAYIAWLNEATGRRFRLPSEAEQEYVIRATSSTPYSWGREVSLACAHGNVADELTKESFPHWSFIECKDGNVYTAAVGRFLGNTFGLHDTTGNVWEWAADCWRENYAEAPRDGRPVIHTADCDVRILRGASWRPDEPGYLRSAHRAKAHRRERGADIGFRLAEDL